MYKAKQIMEIFKQHVDWLSSATYGALLAVVETKSAEIIWNIFLATMVAFITKKFLEYAFDKLKTPWK